MISFAAVLTTWMVILAYSSSSTSSGVEAATTDYMTTPLDYIVYEGGSECSADSEIGTGTVTYLAPLPNNVGSFCENSISQMAATDNNGTDIIQDVTIYTKINIVSCDALEITGMVFVDVYLCSDSVCGDCQDDVEPSKAQLMLPSFDPLPVFDECWGISSPTTLRTTLQQFVSDSNIDAANTYWKIFHDNSCIGDSTTDTDTSDGDADVETTPAASVSGGVAVTTFFSATLAMVLLIVVSL